MLNRYHILSSPGVFDDGGKGSRLHLRDGRWLAEANQGDQGSY